MATTIELFEALKSVANEGKVDFGLYELPVKIGNKKGKLPLLQVFDALVSWGGNLDDYNLGVEFKSPEDADFYPLSQIKIVGAPYSI